MKKLVLAAVMVFGFSSVYASSLCPDGTGVGGSSAILAPDVTGVGGSGAALAPDGS